MTYSEYVSNAAIRLLCADIGSPKPDDAAIPKAIVVAVSLAAMLEENRLAPWRRNALHESAHTLLVSENLAKAKGGQYDT
jgi:hypothetical protein